MIAQLRTIARALAPLEFWVVVAAITATVLTERAIPAALAVAALGVALRWLATGAPGRRTPADWPILGLAVMACLSLFVTERPDLTAPQVSRLLLGIALYYELVSWASDRARLELVALGLCLAGLALAIGAPFGVRWETYKLTFIPRELYSSWKPLLEDYINPNVMAGYLALLLPCVAAPPLFAWAEHAPWRRGLYAVTLAAMLIVLVLTQSRAGLIAAAAGLVALGLLRWRRAWVATVGLAAAGALAGLAFSSRIAASISFVGMPERVEVWSRGWYMVRHFALTGIGMGSFAYRTEQLYPLVLQPTLPHAHNLFMQVAIDLGLPGLVAWLAVLALVVAAGWAAYRHSRAAGDWPLTGLAAGLLAAQVAMAVHGMFDAVTWGMVRPAVLIWGLWGAAVALRQVTVKAGRAALATAPGAE